MTTVEEIKVLLAHPLLKEHLPQEPNFFDLQHALEDFGRVAFLLRGPESLCFVTRADGEVMGGRSECAASPAGAGLDCLLRLLRDVREESHRGQAELEAFLAMQ